MFVENLITGFYNVVAKQKILIFVNYDIDAICAAKILQTIFRYDAVSYTLIPISTVSELVSSYKEHINNVKYVILLNCGGTIDIVENLEPEESVVFFIADSHRPSDVCNIYSLNDQIRLLCKPDSEERIPIFKDDDDDEIDDLSDINEDISDNDEDVNGESRAVKRQRLDEQTVNKRLWEKNRRRILFEYLQFSYYGRSTAILMYELSWQLRRDNFDLLWWGIIGVVEQFILNKVEILQYLNEVEKISAHIGRLCANNAQENSDNLTQNFLSSVQNSCIASTLKINCEKDLQLALYRHWTVENSLRYTMFTAVGLKLWVRGETRLRRLLMKIGMPLADSRRLYCFMDPTLRKEFHSMMERLSDARNLTHITYPSFTLRQRLRKKYQAADYVYSLLALLSNNTRGKTIRDCFQDAMDALLRTRRDLLDDGIEKSKKLLAVMFRHMQNALDRKIMKAGPFYYMVIQEGTVDAKYYSNPDCLWLLATFALKAYVAASRKSQAARLPLIASAPLEEGYCLLVGVPPVAETAPRSFFGKAFEQVAEKTGCVIHADYFDSTAVKLQVADRPKVFDALTILLS